ncbi:DUF4232 domain-containing protein [Streptacidiphilus sp. ASG 303]|uniref:DUF4232 domain-containing protein n=1 Tax=Streptacidiphilus sp. ASG 303 TaxID=2896847 RepID=UPI001E54A5C3|nr:DUF4232 domain-containing protein [Streptacidiphilus sp. ASG 303]MCD0484040.1 DUF4232 domain-containing protein [Streptacidiphilus sp. ASG 303]
MEHQEHTAGGRGAEAGGRRRRGTALRRGAACGGAAALLAALAGCTGGTGTEASAPRTLPGSAAPAGVGTGTAGPAGTPSDAPSVRGSARPGDGRASSPAGGPSAASTAPGASPAASAPTGDGRCRTQDLRASVTPGSPGAGQENFALVLTNASGRTCTVRGFPGAAFVDGAGQQVAPDPERAAGTTPVTVRLRPGQSAWAPMTFANPALTGVTTVVPAAVHVTPPDETAPLTARWPGGAVSNTGKASVPRLGVLRPGTGA